MLPVVIDNHHIFIIEIVLCAALVGLALSKRAIGRRWLPSVLRLLARLGRRPWLAILSIGCLGFASSVIVAWWRGVPVPYVSDEFSYLLAADTYARGRLTNPTHPLWVHFETLGVIQQPTYASKYPPGQGLVLAFGQLIGGHPIVGVWLSIGLMCAAICWMLMAWLPRRWALLGGLLTILHYGFASSWSGSYMGGALAATGGALVFGAMRRLMARPSALQASVLAGGLVILAISRPYEGFIAVLPAAVLLAIWAARRERRSAAMRWVRIVTPAAVILLLAGGGLAYYNWRVTGSPTRMPYVVHEATYAVAPIFVWQRPRPVPAYRHKSLRDEYLGEQEFGNYMTQRTPAGFVSVSYEKLRAFWRLYLGDVFTLPLLALPWALRNRWMRFALLNVLLVFAAILVEALWGGPHYAAPVTALIMLLIVQSLRHIAILRRGRARPGQNVVMAVVTTAVVLPVCFPSLQPLLPSPGWRLEREKIVHKLEQTPGKHLVVVWYTPNHNSHYEWVYNSADIDRSKIVWAREMDPAENRRLLDYFKDRHAWLLVPDDNPPRLTEYPAPSSPTSVRNAAVNKQ